MIRTLWASLLLAGLAACSAPARPAGQNASSSADAAGTPQAAQGGDWGTYNGPLAGDRYSPLTQITTTNVGQLRRVCALCRLAAAA